MAMYLDASSSCRPSAAGTYSADYRRCLCVCEEHEANGGSSETVQATGVPRRDDELDDSFEVAGRAQRQVVSHIRGCAGYITCMLMKRGD
jgi:hypothetical protein